MNSYNREFGISEDNRRMYGKILCKNKTNAYIKSCIQYKESKKKQTNKQNNIKKLNKNKTKQSSKKDNGLIGWKRLAEVYLTWTAIIFYTY